MNRELPYRTIAEGFLDVAKRTLAADGTCMPTVFVCYSKDGNDEHIDLCALSFGGNAEKDAMYQGLWTKYLPLNPQWIMMLNDSYIFKSKTAEDVRNRPRSFHAAYVAGDPRILQCLMFTVYPRGEHAWAVSVTYDDRGPTKKPVFEEPVYIENTSGTDIGGGLGPQPWLVAGNREADVFIRTGERRAI